MTKVSIYQPELECMSREDIKKRQTEGLIWQVKRCYENVAVFRERMDALGITPDESLAATQVVHWEALRQGATLLRVHDVKEAVQTIKLYEKINEK